MSRGKVEAIGKEEEGVATTRRDSNRDGDAGI